MKLSIIIPCYNEDTTLPILLKKIEQLEWDVNYEVIIIDDGSKNNQSQFIKNFLSLSNFKFYRFNENYGKGYALRLGIKKAIGTYIIFQDADLEYFPHDIPKLLNFAIIHDANVVYGNRFNQSPKEMSYSHYIANKILNLITNILYKIKLQDMETGYKLFKSQVIKPLNLSSIEFEIEPEITAKILQQGIQIKQYPIHYKYRIQGEAKINPLDGLESAFLLFKLRYNWNSATIEYIYKIFKFHAKRIIENILSNEG